MLALGRHTARRAKLDEVMERQRLHLNRKEAERKTGEMLVETERANAARARLRIAELPTRHRSCPRPHYSLRRA
jgi:hypothetical protein